ncbi:UNVERIFIED_CONTAM: hypothetical protein Scaly_3140900 [Sesamum calycinum]|uniref:Uncharacterized protein n=1 Tax=Sesamum calycinum TaxID=2727403 RepID=A0AAW2JID2_9LAMI
MNGAVEAEKKKIKNKNILLEIAITYRDWHEMLPFALHAYRTSVRTSTGATPYSIVYGMEAVLPLEMNTFSKVLMETELEEANGQNHDMSSCEEKRLAAMRYVMANFTREGWLKPINK